MKIGDFVFSEYDNGEIVNGEVVNVRGFGDRVLLTVKAEQGYRSIYLDKCITFEYMESAK
jgi:DNA-directed RNA polymerase subunit E'/Rpb7